MARYRKDYELHLPADEVEEEIRSFLEKYNFYETVWKNEDFYCSDIGCIENLKRVYFFKYAYQDGFLHIEAFMREGKSTESNLNGISASDLKIPYRDRLIGLETRLLEKLWKESALYRKNQEVLEGTVRKHLKYVNIAVILVVSLFLFFIIMKSLGYGQ